MDNRKESLTLVRISLGVSMVSSWLKETQWDLAESSCDWSGCTGCPDRGQRQLQSNSQFLMDTLGFPMAFLRVLLNFCFLIDFQSRQSLMNTMLRSRPVSLPQSKSQFLRDSSGIP